VLPADAGSFQTTLPTQSRAAADALVTLKRAVGRIAAEMVSPSPPGIPRILPGQRVTRAQVQYLEAQCRVGMFAMDPSDISLKTLRVVA
jgi:arginine decarboxylase